MEEKLNYRDLVDKLNEASDAYYNSSETMSNKEFDDLFDRLKQMELEQGYADEDSPTRNVGAKAVDSLPKFDHTYPALSLDKTKDIDEFINKFRRGIEDSGEDNNNVVVMYKEDGSTVQAYYNHGKLDKLVTRGNGETGSVITHNASSIKGIPLRIPEKGEVVVRGEALISYSDFEKINAELPEGEQFKNPRNLAAASIQMLDPNEVKKRNVVVKAFNLVHYSRDRVTDKLSGYTLGTTGDTFLDKESDSSTFSGRFAIMEHLGFDLVPYEKCSIDLLRECMNKFSDGVVDYDYPVDGLVAAMDNYSYAIDLEGTEHHPNIMQGYAFKWADETAETVLRKIEWSPSRTGLLNPVAVFDPVELEGTTVQRASLHNLSIMKQLNIQVGDRLAVYKANKIIPQVLDNLDKESHPNMYVSVSWVVAGLLQPCPTCGADPRVHTSPEGIQTVHCPNPDCPEKLIGKLAHFCSRDCMDIQGMSEETIQKLVDAGFIKEYADFFKLDQKPGIAFLPGFGKQSWKKMCDAAQKAQTTDFVHFMTALSIPNIGKGQAKTLLKYIDENYDELCPPIFKGHYNPVGMLMYMAQNNFDFTDIPGFGLIMHEELTRWAWTHFLVDTTPEIRVYNAVNFTDRRSSLSSTNSSISGKSFCITGKLIHFNNRQELVDKIESLGGKWVDSVSTKTDFLINNDITSTSGKNKKAIDLGIPIISEETFLDMIKEDQ